MIGLMSLKEKLIKLCDQKGWNQAALAKRMNVAKTTVQPWFSGKGKPSEKNLLRLARELEVSVDYLTDDSQEKPPGPELNETERQILDLFRALGLDKLEGLRRLAGKPPRGPIMTGDSIAELKALKEEEEKQRKGNGQGEA